MNTKKKGPLGPFFILRHMFYFTMTFAVLTRLDPVL